MQVGSELIDHYKRELAQLRADSADFAQRYPRVAARLCLDGGESADPHTEHLIESVAFIAARAQRALEHESPRLAAALLEAVCPSLAQPVPSMSVAAFELDPKQGQVTAGLRVPRHTLLKAANAAGQDCWLRTVWELQLWPLHCTQALLHEGRELRLAFECLGGTTLQELALERLCLHLQGDSSVTMPLYELLSAHVAGVRLVPGGGGAPVALPRGAWREMGLDEAEAALPNPPQAPPGHALLQEYFALPQKFLFFELAGLRARLGSGRRFELRLQLRGLPAGLRRIDAEAFALHCVPVVNLFPRSGEPLRADGRCTELLLVGDQRREASTEVHSVLSVHTSHPGAQGAEGQRVESVPAFGALTPQQALDDETVFWWARRDSCLRAGLAGSDTWLSLVDARRRPRALHAPVVHTRLLCTSRGAAALIPAGARMQPEGLSAGVRARCLYTPSAQRPAPAADDTLWQLLSLLRLNHASLLEGATDDVAAAPTDDAVQPLRTLLALVGGSDPRHARQLQGLQSLRARSAMARLGSDGWRGWCRGTHVDVTLDADAFAGGSPLLLGAVLARLLAGYTTLNSFVRLSLHGRGGELRQWPAMAGSQVLL